MTSQIDALVAGGGPAGAALAIALARAGRSIVLFEARPEPCQKVCGEFISCEAIARLSDLGLSVPSLRGERVAILRWCVGSRSTDVELPFPAYGVSRAVLDHALLEEAVRSGVRLVKGRVASLSRGNDHWLATLAGGEAFCGRSAFLATGKHDLPKLRRPTQLGRRFVGFKTHLALEKGRLESLAGAVELFMFAEGYAGLQRVGGDRVNLCLVLEQRRLITLGGGSSEVLAYASRSSPLLGRRLSGAQPLDDRACAVWPIPYGHLSRADDGLWRIGDQAAVIPSFCGEGVAIALYSARLAARTFLSGASAGSFQRDLASRLASRMRFARALSWIVSHGPALAVSSAILRVSPGSARRIATATRVPTL